MLTWNELWTVLTLRMQRGVTEIFPKCFHWVHWIQWQKYLSLRGLEPATSCVRGQDATTVSARHVWEIGSLNWTPFILQWYISFTPLRKKLHCSTVNVLIQCIPWYAAKINNAEKCNIFQKFSNHSKWQLKTGFPCYQGNCNLKCVISMRKSLRRY